MPKSKKQKTQHNHQPYSTRQHQNQHHTSNTGNENLSHEEIWDDSALIRSWDDAVREYEFYHSIHARGEDVDEVLRRAELAEQEETRQRMNVDQGSARGQRKEKLNADGNDGAAAQGDEDGGDEESEEEGEIDEHLQLNDTQVPTISTNRTDSSLTTQHPTITTTKPPLPTSGQPTNPIDIAMNNPTNPQDKADPPTTDPNQTLENLKMAYYWAGYYSGLYDSQRGKQGVEGEGVGKGSMTRVDLVGRSW